MAEEKLQFVIQVDDNGSATIRRVAGELKNLRETSSTVPRALSGLGSGLLSTAAGAFLLEKAIAVVHTGFERFLAPTVEAGEQLLNLSRRFGVTVGEMAGFQALPQSAGVDTINLTYAFRQLNLALATIGQPGSRAAAVLRDIGLTGQALKDFLAKPPTEKVKELIDLFDKFQDTPSRFAALATLFGRGAQAIQQVINTGTAETRAELETFQKQYGLAIDDATAHAADRLNLA